MSGSGPADLPLRSSQAAVRFLKAPWTAEQVKNLNAYQNAGWMHPFTCGNRDDGNHPRNAVLVATECGWECPHCDYRQDWAHPFMAEQIPPHLRELMGVALADRTESEAPHETD